MNGNQNNDSKSNNNKIESSIGALWIRKNDQDIEYFSIKVTIEGKTYHLKSFMNGAKQSEDDKKPHYLIYHSLNKGNNTHTEKE